MESSGVVLRLFLLFAACVHWAQSVADVAETSRNFRDDVTTESTAVATTVQSIRHPRWYKRGGHEDDEEDRADQDMDHHDDDEDEDHDDVGQTKAISHGKHDYWGGYYDFLINEGSYKFWAVFQLATAALLIYSGFAALYYAKVNPSTTDDYEDYFLRRRRRRRRDLFLGLEPETFQQILDAVSTNIQSHHEFE